MPPVTQADPGPRRLGSRSPLQITRDLAALVGAAVTIGFAAGMGLMLTVLVLG
jgi:hypothetical protein